MASSPRINSGAPVSGPARPGDPCPQGAPTRGTPCPGVLSVEGSEGAERAHGAWGGATRLAPSLPSSQLRTLRAGRSTQAPRPAGVVDRAPPGSGEERAPPARTPPRTARPRPGRRPRVSGPAPAALPAPAPGPTVGRPPVRPRYLDESRDSDPLDRESKSAHGEKGQKLESMK